MDQTTTVWLLRHGEADGMNGRCCGWYDAPLSPEGMEQAKRVAAQLARQPITRMYSSCLERAFQTAQIVAEPHNLDVEKVDGLAEMHFGDLEGLTYQEAEERFPAVYRSWMTRPLETRFPNGESFIEMKTRVLHAFDSIVRRHRNQSIVVVAHAGVNRVLLCRTLGIPENKMFELSQPHCAVNRIELNG